MVVHTEKYRRHTVLFQKMRTANMSADESDSPDPTLPRVRRIILANWQSMELRNFLWALDAKYLSTTNRPTDGKRRTPGNKACVRQVCDTSRAVAGVAPPGLWINCYDPVWLENLPEWEVEQMEIINQPYDFTLDPPHEDAANTTGPNSSL
ncbi:hypothetical protein C8Q80DRAFT_1097403 [Daedaleopsis nitida]|nr:hypothetical protein C8Q80DRAFT_1097403 [Daedaleopsis nitida]